MTSMVSTSFPFAMRWFTSQSRITPYSLGKLFRTWIIKSSSVILPFRQQWWGYVWSILTYQPVPYDLAGSHGKICTFWFLTNPNFTLSKEELVLIDRITSSYASSFNSANFLIFLLRSILPSNAFLYHPEYEFYPCLMWSSYLMAAFLYPFYIPHERNFLGSFPNQLHCLRTQ